ncbi:MAG: DNA alkylation repair protein [Thaumarchaeota archaeon]|nr:DNA alkylation repair protein [Nitrososphaerota archaeon]
MEAQEVIRELRSLADPGSLKGMARYGISTGSALGLAIPTLRRIARKTGRDHGLALELWKSGIHEARILAALVDEPAKVTERQMEAWVADFDSWDVCDGCCGSLFDKTPFAFSKALEWSKRKEEFVKRAGYVLMAELAVHDKAAPDAAFLRFFGAIERGASDPRNFVKKAVSWALRQIGKRNKRLNREALNFAARISGLEGGAARWVASDAARELRSEAVQKKLRSSS